MCVREFELKVKEYIYKMYATSEANLNLFTSKSVKMSKSTQIKSYPNGFKFI